MFLLLPMVGMTKMADEGVQLGKERFATNGLLLEPEIKTAQHKNLKPQQYDRKGKLMFRKACLKEHGLLISLIHSNATY